MPEPRTIDNLGVEPSIRWASDQELLDKTMIQEAGQISKQTEIDIYAPFYKSEFDLIFETKQRHQQWAMFSPPVGYNSQKKRLFTHQAIPSLGTEELQQKQMQTINDFLNRSVSKQEQEGTSLPDPKGYAWEGKREKEARQNESKTLLDLMTYIHSLDALLKTINGKRSQYSKG